MECFIKKGKKRFDADDELRDLVVEASMLKAQTDVMKEQYEGLNSAIEAYLSGYFTDTGTLTVEVPGVCSVQVTLTRYKVFLPDMAEKAVEWLKEKGREVSRYVKTVYSPRSDFLLIEDPKVFDFVTVKHGKTGFNYDVRGVPDGIETKSAQKDVRGQDQV